MLIHSANDPIKKMMIVTDAWRPQINGVVQTYMWLSHELSKMGKQVEFLTPERFRTFALPTYPDIQLSWTRSNTIANILDRSRADFVHIATEGPLGWHARRHCLAEGRAFSTCYHTRYPEYISARIPLPPTLTYFFLKRFHNAGAATLVATRELQQELGMRGFSKTAVWRRGINVDLFRHGPSAQFDFPRPYFLFVGRLAVEKNLEGFLALDLPGSKIVVGDGPARRTLERQFPQANFLGARHGADLAAIYRSSDVFVFPSRTDTYGLVMAEALAAGTPVAAFPTAGAKAILRGSKGGIIGDDLRLAALEALTLDREICQQTGALHSMRASAHAFLDIVGEAAGKH